MNRRTTLFATVTALTLLAISEAALGFGGSLVGRIHQGFVAVFVDAANFVQGCF